MARASSAGPVACWSRFEARAINPELPDPIRGVSSMLAAVIRMDEVSGGRRVRNGGATPRHAGESASSHIGWTQGGDFPAGHSESTIASRFNRSRCLSGHPTTGCD